MKGFILAATALLTSASLAQAQCVNGVCRPQQASGFYAAFSTVQRTAPTACACTPTTGCGCQGQCAPAATYQQPQQQRVSYYQPQQAYYVQQSQPVYYAQPQTICQGGACYTVQTNAPTQQRRIFRR